MEIKKSCYMYLLAFLLFKIFILIDSKNLKKTLNSITRVVLRANINNKDVCLVPDKSNNWVLFSKCSEKQSLDSWEIFYNSSKMTIKNLQNGKYLAVDQQEINNQIQKNQRTFVYAFLRNESFEFEYTISFGNYLIGINSQKNWYLDYSTSYQMYQEIHWGVLYFNKSNSLGLKISPLPGNSRVR